MKQGKFILFLFTIFFINGIGVAQKPPLNLTVLLDLSDRVLLKDQIQRDKQVLDTLFAIFEEEVRNNLFIKSDDRFSIVIAHQKNKNIELENMNFRIEMDKFNPQDKKKEFKSKKEQFRPIVNQIYEKAKHSKSKKDYSGADIWSFMKYDYQNYYHNNYRNVLIILTDGYLYFEPDVKRPAPKKNRYYSMNFIQNLRKHNYLEIMNKDDIGIQSIERKYPNCNVILLEVNPHTELFIDEEELLLTIWDKWFKEMGAKSSTIVTKQPMYIIKEKVVNTCK
ncbi:MAG: hypothetical protein N2450_06405 [bacterium]|nr:hypothetical protein [bacterium]